MEITNRRPLRPTGETRPLLEEIETETVAVMADGMAAVMALVIEMRVETVAETAAVIEEEAEIVMILVTIAQTRK